MERPSVKRTRKKTAIVRRAQTKVGVRASSRCLPRVGVLFGDDEESSRCSTPDQTDEEEQQGQHGDDENHHAQLTHIERRRAPLGGWHDEGTVCAATSAGNCRKCRAAG
jgi:hypothetical protein